MRKRKTKDRREAPVRAGQEVEVEVVDLGSGGEGVARLGAFTVFVPGALPGEAVAARVTDVKARYARATLAHVLRASPDRAAPPCPVYDACGGCQLQHLAYPAQLARKHAVVVEALARHGVVGATVHPALGMDDPWRYRHKAQFPVGVRGGTVVAGFFASGTHDIVDVDACLIQHPLGDRVLREVKVLAAAYGVPVYDEAAHRGVLRHVLVRVSHDTGEALAVLVTNGPAFLAGERLAADLTARVPGLVGVVQNVNAARTNAVLGRESRVLAGRGTLTERIGDLVFTISPVSFFQVNPAQAAVLYDVARRHAGLTGRERVVDLYCGTGTIALYLARHAASVLGVEVVDAAVEDARASAARNGIDNARFVAGDAAVAWPRLAAAGARADVVVLDPPRRGCDAAVLEAAAATGPDRMVYVSCNPETLARDLALLADLGYRTDEVQPVDLFPHTTHVECCARLSKSPKDEGRNAK